MTPERRHLVYLFLDLEMNTWKNVSGDLSSEIIEIGAVLMDEKLRIIDTFSELVRPTLRKKLSPYCLRLTGIDKKKLYSALSLDQVIVNFDNWIDDYNEIKTVFSWNESDYRQVLRECAAKEINTGLISILEERYLDFQKIFGKEFDWPTCGLNDAMKVFSIKQSGRAHRALNDAMDLARLYKKMVRTSKDYRRYDYIKEEAHLRKIEKLNPIVRSIKEMKVGKQPSKELDNKIREMILRDFHLDLTKTFSKFNAKDIINSFPEITDWLTVLEGMIIDIESDGSVKETAASSCKELASGK